MSTHPEEVMPGPSRKEALKRAVMPSPASLLLGSFEEVSVSPRLLQERYVEVWEEYASKADVVNLRNERLARRFTGLPVVLGSPPISYRNWAFVRLTHSPVYRANRLLDRKNYAENVDGLWEFVGPFHLAAEQGVLLSRPFVDSLTAKWEDWAARDRATKLAEVLWDEASLIGESPSDTEHRFVKVIHGLGHCWQGLEVVPYEGDASGGLLKRPPADFVDWFGLSRVIPGTTSTIKAVDAWGVFRPWWGYVQRGLPPVGVAASLLAGRYLSADVAYERLQLDLRMSGLPVVNRPKWSKLTVHEDVWRLYDGKDFRLVTAPAKGELVNVYLTRVYNDTTDLRSSPLWQVGILKPSDLEPLLSPSEQFLDTAGHPDLSPLLDYVWENGRPFPEPRKMMEIEAWPYGVTLGAPVSVG